ncbi:hypothetical protein [Trinickia dinghuensis]|uniref:hypothetical protein n=1 Tax=Trinickia dinghuensis TaxID=2291023 RepID=UPI0011C020CE|nr:hypothetical protein [Trinickia dinghuensis]
MKQINHRLCKSFVAALSAIACSAAYSQVSIVQQPATGESLGISTSNASQWVADLTGGCGAGNVCIGPVAATSQIGPAVQFAFYPSPSIAQVDASVGIYNPNPSSPVPNDWDLTSYNKITFYYRDQNTSSVVNGNSSLSHYFLIYDNNKCYREWVINLANTDGTPAPNSPTIQAGVWYQITGSFTDPQGAFIIQGGNAVNGVSCASQPLNYQHIVYFETGIFSGTMRPQDGRLYNWEVGPVTPTP